MTLFYNIYEKFQDNEDNILNNHCYKYKEYKYNKGFLDNFVDATYIITMVDSHDRHNDINKQLEEYIPTKKIYILYNYGYKKCNKILKEKTSSFDIIDANTQIFHHSVKNNFNNILILEDDFIFDPKIKDTKIITEIKNFFELNNHENICFNLGGIPFLFQPNIDINNNIFKSYYMFASHANIYNKNIQHFLINKINDLQNDNNIKHWDYFITKFNNIYFYKNPLCYQLFPETENQKVWASKTNIYSCICNFILMNSIKLFNIDKQIQPGYSNIYNILFFFNYSIHIVIIIIILYIIHSILLVLY